MAHSAFGQHELKSDAGFVAKINIADLFGINEHVERAPTAFRPCRWRMNALAIGAIVFVSVFGGALLGMFLSVVLPKDHLSSDSKDVIRLATAMLATLAALVVGLLIASAKIHSIIRIVS